MTADVSIFDFPEEVQILQNKDVLSPDYVPPRLIGRDEQTSKVAYLMRHVLKNKRPDNILIFGPPGCGKTVVSRHVLNSLEAKLELEPINIKVEWVYIHCKKVYTSTSVLYTLIQHLDPGTKAPRTGHSLNFYYDELFKLMNEKNTALIVILDEIDFLRSDNVLYNFSRAVANEELKDGRFISIIGLSNSLKYEETLDERVLSSMGFTKLRFPPYQAQAIYNILNDRIALAFVPDAISEEILGDCAIDAANAGGDIRKALCVLKTAAELAVEDGISIISKSHLKNAEVKIQMEEIIKSVVELPLHHKIVLASIIKSIGGNKKYVYSGEVVKMYKKLCEYVEIKPLDSSMVSKSISSLELQSFIHYEKVNMGKRGGKSRMITVRSEDVDKMKQGIYEDYNLEELSEYFPVVEGV